MKTIPYLFVVFTVIGCTRMSPMETAIDFEKEKQEIFTVIANETKYYFEENYEQWRACHLDTSYFRSYGYWEGWKVKVKYYNGFDTLDQVKKAQFKRGSTLWKGSTEIRSNENARIFNDIAWVTYEQTSIDNATQDILGRSLETRILEKHSDKWKLVYLGFHFLPDSIP